MFPVLCTAGEERKVEKVIKYNIYKLYRLAHAKNANSTRKRTGGTNEHMSDRGAGRMYEVGADGLNNRNANKDNPEPVII
jgi:hypothetical protein